jgi:hypothetical protein
MNSFQASGAPPDPRPNRFAGDDDANDDNDDDDDGCGCEGSWAGIGAVASTCSRQVKINPKPLVNTRARRAAVANAFCFCSYSPSTSCSLLRYLRTFVSRFQEQCSHRNQQSSMRVWGRIRCQLLLLLLQPLLQTVG